MTNVSGRAPVTNCRPRGPGRPRPRTPGPGEEQLSLTVEHDARTARPGDGHPIVLHFHGEVDMVSAPALRQGILPHLGGGHPVVVLDLSGVTFFGARGVSALMTAQDTAEHQHIELRVVSNRSTVPRVLRAADVGDVLPVYDSVAAAIAEPRHPTR
ncbi:MULTISPECIES: STAS domain-containing protein [Actinoalloteichus]|uniref:Anti-sigma factor antagonist n=1 Tax=Actinoalloteichus caeruleus DSM 43889 TaxID=1120930 RepID=A0ABT1JBL1_ACTCY|nr:STAS domain-containing protein [Actinoalloteichus caeruleus]MCP2329823.1 anti-anti-sigma factor [Actinoalloteichus caeruleus DSM 43889]